MECSLSLPGPVSYTWSKKDGKLPLNARSDNVSFVPRLFFVVLVFLKFVFGFICFMYRVYYFALIISCCFSFLVFVFGFICFIHTVFTMFTGPGVFIFFSSVKFVYLPLL